MLSMGLSEIEGQKQLNNEESTPMIVFYKKDIFRFHSNGNVYTFLLLYIDIYM